jgi:hypothetical protein
LDATQQLWFALHRRQLWLPEDRNLHPNRWKIMRIFDLILLWALLSGVSASQTQSNFSPAATPSTSSATTPAPPPAYDPLLDPPPLARANLTLIGGSIANLDPVLNRITLRPFGDKHKMRIAFDTRTKIYVDGTVAAESSLQTGQRVYIDTMLNGTAVFAKSIQIETKGMGGSGRGQILDYDSASGALTLRDELSNQPAHFQVSSSAVVHTGNQTGSLADLVPGSLVALTFGTQQNHAVVEEVSLLAKPGSSFTFFGKITYVDMSRKIVAVDNQNDQKNYEIHLTSIPQSMMRNLHEGTVVDIAAIFDGSQYVARNLTFRGSASQP